MDDTKNSKCVNTYRANSLYLVISKVNEYVEEINWNKYLTLFPTNKNKEKIKQYEELWSEIRYLIRSITKNSDGYDKKYMKIRFNLDDELPLNKVIEINRYQMLSRSFLDEFLYKLWVI